MNYLSFKSITHSKQKLLGNMRYMRLSLRILILMLIVSVLNRCLSANDIAVIKKRVLKCQAGIITNQLMKEITCIFNILILFQHRAVNVFYRQFKNIFFKLNLINYERAKLQKS